MNPQHNTFSYPPAYPYAYPPPQQPQVRQYEYHAPTQQPQPQQHAPFYVNVQPPAQNTQPPPQSQQQLQRQLTPLQPHVQHPRPNTQPPPPKRRSAPPPRQQQQSVATASSPASDVGPGAPPADPSSPNAELEAQLLDALNDDTQRQSTQNLGQLYPNQGDDEEPIYNLPPPPEDTYPSEEAMEKAMHDWTLEHGYEVVRRASKRNARNEIYKRYYDCSKHSRKPSKLPEEQRKRKSRKIIDTSCPMSLATVAVDPSNPAGEWQIRHRKTWHNHPPEEGKQLVGHRRRFRDENLHKAVDGLFALGTSTAQVMQFLAKTNSSVLFTRTDIANMKMKWKQYGNSLGEKSGEEPKNTGVATKAAGGACHKCRSKHYACDSVRPRCTKCRLSGSECTYDKPAPPPVTATPTATEQNADNVINVDEDITMQMDDTPQQPQPTPSSAVPRKRGRPQGSSNKPALTPTTNPGATEEILDRLRSFQQENFTPTRLEEESSSVIQLAQSTCGTGDVYKNLPTLTSANDWQNFRNHVVDISLRVDTYDVLINVKSEPQRPPTVAAEMGKASEIESWNEYIKRLAIWKRRNQILLSALLSHLSPYYRNRVNNFTKASEVWDALEDVFKPRGCEQAFRLFIELHSITLQTSVDLKDYIHRLQTTYEKFKQLTLNTSPLPPHLLQRVPKITSGAEAVPEEMVCLLFLQNLGPEWRRWVDGLCATNNIGGFGTGDKLGLTELCKRAVNYEAMQRRELGRS